jgi:hypothetical protein
MAEKSTLVITVGKAGYFVRRLRLAATRFGHGLWLLVSHSTRRRGLFSVEISRRTVSVFCPL